MIDSLGKDSTLTEFDSASTRLHSTLHEQLPCLERVPGCGSSISSSKVS